MTEKNNLASYTVRETSNAHRGPITQLGWNCNGRKLATGSTDNTVRVWSIETTTTGRERRDVELQIGREVNCLHWHPGHPDQLATCAADNFIKVWDVRTGKAITVIKLRKSGYLFLAWSPGDPNTLAAVHQDSETFFVDIKKEKAVKSLPSRGLYVNQVRFSRDGKLFFRAVSSGGVEVFTYPELVRLHCLMGHASQAYSLDIDKSEGLLASGGQDATVSVFELQTLTCLRTFIGFDQAARYVSFSHDGRYLAYVAESPTVDPGVYIEEVATGKRAAFLATAQAVEVMRWNPKRLILAFTGTPLTTEPNGVIRVNTPRSGGFNIYAPK